jgi:hypothetical protein
MPIYEEKLICPLAVCFTQEHIRPKFQDGYDLEETIKAITTRPGTDSYDVILEAPFPVIEIMRWRPRDSENTQKNWFTLDNRRLYCLQRAAVALWPRRAAISVEVLYAAPEGALRKSDSSTAGRSVGIGHSLKTLTDQWSWREAMTAEHQIAAECLANADDARATVKDLSDAPARPSMLDLFLHAAPTGRSVAAKLSEETSDSSTRGPSTPRSAGGGSASVSDDMSPISAPTQVGKRAPNFQLPPPAATLGELLVGMWENEAYEAYEVKAVTANSWSCSRKDVGSSAAKQITLWYDEKSDAVCWGNSWSMFADASALRKQSDELRWFSGSDTAMQRARFTWWKAQDSTKASKPQRKQQQLHHRGKSTGDAKNKGR